MAVTDYFTYERRIAEDHLVPWLRRHGALPASGRVLDVGCGYGGTLGALLDASPGLAATGIDLDAQMVAEGKLRLARAELLAADFFEWSGGHFDLILMRDVLEHIRRPEAALLRAASMLAPGGWLFASFAPFYGPFGGHQHNGAGFFSALPWLQLLPSSVFRRLLRVEGNSYKGQGELDWDMESVQETRLTLGRFLGAAAGAGLRVVTRQSYLSRPDYRIKFGIPALPLPAWSSELLATGVEALLQS